MMRQRLARANRKGMASAQHVADFVDEPGPLATKRKSVELCAVDSRIVEQAYYRFGKNASSGLVEPCFCSLRMTRSGGDVPGLVPRQGSVKTKGTHGVMLA
jgi:hypothetical protein